MASGSINRTGRVSSIDYKRGTYEVTYFDRGQSVTRQINAISNGEYKMPKIGQMVSVMHNSNGSAAGVTVGTVWNESNKPAEGYEGLFRKEYSNEQGQAYERFDANTGVYTQFIPTRTGRNCKGEIYDEAKGPISMIGGGQVQLSSSGGSISIQAAQGAGINAGTNVSIESGADTSIESGGQMGIAVGDKFSIVVTGETSIEHSDKVEVKANGATITISASGDISITSPTKIEMSAPKIDINAPDGDVKIKNVSLIDHKHAGGPKPDK